MERPDTRAANCIALVGAVRHLTLTDVSIVGGCTGIAVHWGAVGDSVSSISGPSYHPHHIDIQDLVVSDAFEGFYLSSVHDVSVQRARLSDVEIGFRLLPGDNTDRFHVGDDNAIGQRIRVSEARVSWNGPLYAIRIAGWGRSEVDHSVRVLEYRDVVVTDCTLVPLPVIGAKDPLRSRTPSSSSRRPGCSSTTSVSTCGAKRDGRSIFLLTDLGSVAPPGRIRSRSAAAPSACSLTYG